MKRGELLNKHICEINILNIFNETAKIVNFHFSHYKSMGNISCHSIQSSYPTATKTQLFVPHNYRCYICNLKRIGFTALEEKSFENIDGGRRTD